MKFRHKNNLRLKYSSHGKVLIGVKFFYQLFGHFNYAILTTNVIKCKKFKKMKILIK